MCLWVRKINFFLFHRSISCIGDFLHIHSSSDFVVLQCPLWIPQLHFWMSLICRRLFFLSSPILFLTGPPYRSLIFFSFGDQNSISGWQSCHCRWECGCPNCQQPSFQWQKCYSIKQRNYDYLDNKIHHRYCSLKTKH